MIISKQDGKLVLVRQDEHAIQMGDVARKWGNENFEKLLNHESVSLGIEKHDAGWRGPDDEVLFNSNTKRPTNFLEVNLPEHVRFYELGYRETLKQDPYAGMMLGMHWIGLYTSRFGYDPTFTYKVSDDLVEFMNNTVANIQKEWIDVKLQYWQKQQQRSEFEDHVWMQYEFFQVMDLLGLFMGLNDPKIEKEVSLGPIRMSRKSDPINLTVKSNGNGTLLVHPFPFADEFETSVPGRRIEDREYESHQEAKQIVEGTEKEDIVWKIVAS
ncbi:DUF3891 family protein [Peribacillus saganii]|uniref:DUF3891 family protein n=1 Tax=Peribacillus saganii TaxID=2303992 RepID=A0A372LQL9_9BACI|nr:DUF3891 family protein [Peribacillus saganii]RFU70505.1 DUF3891 family protein [Peribacillus saganii]